MPIDQAGDEQAVLLVRPFDGVRAEDKTYDHLGIGYLSSYLESRGIRADVSDMVLGTESTTAEVARRVSESAYRLVGISATSQLGFPEVVEVARAIKRDSPSTHICIGGHFPTVAHDKLLRDFDCFDSVVRGEGEEPLHDLATRVLGGKELVGLHGVTYRHQDEVVVGPRADLIQDLDTLPFPKRHFMPPEYGGIRYATMVSSRGCQYRCSFCSVQAFYGCGWRARSADNIVAEMVELHQREGCDGFDFADDSFIPVGQEGSERIRQLCDAIKGSGLQDLTLIALLTAAQVNDEAIHQLREVGLKSALIGIESASAAVLRRFHKGATPEINERAIQVLHRHGIEINAGFIMFDPETTLEDIEANIAFLKRHSSYLIFEMLSRLSVYTGTPIYEELEAQGLLKGDYLNPDYEFADPKIAWLHAVSNGLMERWMGVVSDWTRGFKWGTGSLPAPFRRARRQKMFQYALEVFTDLTDLVKSASELPSVDEAISRLSPGVNMGFEQLVSPIAEEDMNEIRNLVPSYRHAENIT